MDAAKPALEEAKQALQMVKAADITEIKNLPNPSDDIRTVCALTFYFYTANSKDASWASVKANMLNDMKLLTPLQTYEITSCRPE